MPGCWDAATPIGSRPKHYTWAQYVADMVTLIARLDVEAVNWLGTSMGGMVGMALAAQPGNPIRKLVLNDAAPVISKTALSGSPLMSGRS